MSEKKNNIEKENTKSSKKIILIAIILLVIIIIATIGGIFGYQQYEESKTTGTEWGDTYYAYLKSATSKDSNKEEYGLKEGMKNTQLQFIEVGENNPVMLMTYDYEEDSYVNIYRTNGENQVDKIVYQEPARVDFLYDIQYKSYAWYIHTENETEDSYKKIYTVLENPEQNNEAEYTITKGDTTAQNTVSGETITLSKFDETFVKPVIEASTKIDFTEDITNKDLKKNISEGIDGYKTQDKIVTEEIKKATENKVTEVENTKQSIETAKAEVKAEEERKAAEEAKRKEEEEAKKGLQVGPYRLKYGTYKTDAANMGDYYGTLQLKPNGVFHIKSNCDVTVVGGEFGYEKLDCDGTYIVTKVQNSFEYFDGLKFTTNQGKTFSFEASKAVDGSIYLSDQWHSYKYQGN